MFIMILLAAAMIPFSPAAAKGASEGARLFALTVLPSLFPFIVCANYVVGESAKLESLRLGRTAKTISADILCAVCGSPSAVILIEKACRRGEYGFSEASVLCAAFNQAGPAFIVSALSVGMLGSVSYAPALAFCHYLPPLVFSVVYGVLSKRPKLRPYAPTENKQFTPLGRLSTSISDAVTTVMKIGGTIVFFRTVFSVLEEALRFDKLPFLARGAVFGLLEMTNGASILSGHPAKAELAAICFLTSFGGAAIFIQSKMLFPELKAGRYFAVKALYGVISAILMLLLFPFIKADAAVLGDLSESISGLSETIRNRTIGTLAVTASAGAAIIISILYAKLASGK